MFYNADKNNDNMDKDNIINIPLVLILFFVSSFNNGIIIIKPNPLLLLSLIWLGQKDCNLHYNHLLKLVSSINHCFSWLMSLRNLLIKIVRIFLLEIRNLQDF